jgi:hypothetical protein
MNILSDYPNGEQHLGCRDAETLFTGFSACMRLYLQMQAGSDALSRDAESARASLLAARTAYWSHIQTHHCVHYQSPAQKQSAPPVQRNVRPGPTARKFAPFLEEPATGEAIGRRPWRFVPKPIRAQSR